MIEVSRRQVLKSASGGFGMLALAGLIGQQAKGAVKDFATPLAPKEPHFTPKAKRLIFVHMNGSMSHHDTFD